MDKFNVINQTQDIVSLENDLYQWSQLPYKFRVLSEAECKRRHGCTNREYYDRKMSELTGMNHLIVKENDEGFVDTAVDSSIESNKFYDACEKAKQLKLAQNIELIVPMGKDVASTESLIRAYQTYLNLPHKYKIISDEYSRQLFGMNVTSMYNHMMETIGHPREIHATVDESTDLDTYYAELHEIKDAFQPVSETIDHMIAIDDKIGLIQMKMHQYHNIPDIVREQYELCNEKIDDAVNQKVDYNSLLPHFVPYFTPDEMMDNSYVESLDYDTWKERLIEAAQYADMETLKTLGWNPSVAFTEANLNYARLRQARWLENHMPTVVDLTNLSDRLDSMHESTAAMRKYYQTKNLYPIYIVLSFTDTFFGNVIRKVKNSTYTHAGLSLDSDLDMIYTFNFGKEYNGFTVEDLQSYTRKSKRTIIDVIAVFVDEKTKHDIRKTLDNFEKKRTKTRYSFGNILNILFNRAEDLTYPENLALVCSQFVDLILKLAHIDLFEKPNNLVLPQDFADIVNNKDKNPHVYKVYEGLGSEYQDNIVERNIGVLFAQHAVKDIRYPKSIKIDFNDISNKAGIIESLNQIADLLTPSSIIYERYIPLRITDKGDLDISYRKDMEQQYQESHKLLSSYTSTGIEGTKSELAHLFALNSDIEDKIKRMKKGDPSYKELVDLRARIINDFKKYMKVVLKEQPDFDFSAYFRDSPYYNGSISIHASTLKYTGQMISKFLRAQGF